MNFKENRPEGYIHKNDILYQEIINSVNQIIPTIQKGFEYKTLTLSKIKTNELSTALIEFAEDIYNDIGIWKCLEKRNVSLFKNPLPFIPKRNIYNKEINKNRVQYFLWNLYQLINPERLLSPNHKDLDFFAKELSEVLNDFFKKMPTGSGVKEYLHSSNKYGWDIKRKLIWLGKNSYLFRYNFNHYFKKYGNKDTISATDDFVCQELTSWSGLGVVDVLKETAGLSEAQKNDLEKWHERHIAYYYVTSINGPVMMVKNIINDRTCKIRVGDLIKQFKMNQLISGGLVPWKSEWYWSGEQKIWHNLSNEEIDEARKSFIEKSGKLTYRYAPELLKKANTTRDKDFENFKKYHSGQELVIYQDGLTMAADEQKRHRLVFETKPKTIIEKFIKDYDLPGPFPKMKYPKSILECKSGVGVFFNKNVGIEYFIDINPVISGLEKNGKGLNEEETDRIRELILSDMISPQFVETLIRKYGHQSIAECFVIRNIFKNLYLKFLFYKYKGSYFRTQYPNYTLTNI
jgi:hypothetical protein